MKVLFRIAQPLPVLGLLLMLAACGGNSSPRTSALNPTPTTPIAAPSPPATPTPPAPAPAPTPPAPAPGPSPTPPPTPPSPTPSPTPPPAPNGTNPGMFQALMIQQNASSSVSGQIGVDLVADDGKGVLQLNNAADNASYALDFCPFPSAFPNAQQNSCTSVTDFKTNTMGQATVNFQFPKTGVWAGIFVVVRDHTVEFASGFNVPGKGQQYRSTLKQASSVSSGTGGMNPGGDALKHGSVSVQDSTAEVEVQNATINVTYDVIFCLNGGGSSCSQIGTLSTDQTGSGKTDIDLLHALGTLPDATGIFRLNRSQPLPSGGDAGGVQFMTAFVSGCTQTRCE